MSLFGSSDVLSLFGGNLGSSKPRCVIPRLNLVYLKSCGVCISPWHGADFGVLDDFI